MNAEELSEDLKNFQLLELSYFYTTMSAADAIPSPTVDQPITQSVEQTWLTRTLAEGEISPHPEIVKVNRESPHIGLRHECSHIRSIHAPSQLDPMPPSRSSGQS